MIAKNHRGFFQLRTRGVFGLGLALLVLLLALSFDAEAQNRPRPRPRRPAPKSIKTAITGDDSGAYDLRLGNTLDELMLSSTDTRIYDEITISGLERMKEIAQPDSDPQDMDPAKTRHLAEKALAIEAGRRIFALLRESELKGSYNLVRRAFSGFQEFFRYSVQDVEGGLDVQKKTSGKKLVELNLELNTRQGLDPQLSLGENLRFRWDYFEKRPLLEYQADF